MPDDFMLGCRYGGCVRRVPGLVLLAVILVLWFLSVTVQMRHLSQASIIAASAVTPAPVAMILGASVKRDGTPSDALRDRLEVGKRLYQDGRVSKLLVTGDDGKFHINEVSVMKRVLMEQGVPPADVLIDGHGYRTYESCARAARVFGIQRAIVVTQRFHLPRALYLCSHLGIEVQGVAADLQTYERIVFFTTRDLIAGLKAWWDISIIPPVPPVRYDE